MYLGIDLGTSGVKVVLMDDAGAIIDQASTAISVSRPQPLWSEQNPDDWFEATDNSVKQLQQRCDLSQVRAIGFSGQMHGATLLDANGAVIRPAILWNDGRSEAQCQALEKAVPNSREITGNLAMPGFTAPKVLWVKEHEPENFERIAKVLLPKDYLRFKMTGDFASDMSDSAGTLWLDVAKRDWSDAMLAACGLSQAHMPKLYEGSDVTGYLSAPLATAWGMAQVPVAAGAGDNAAGAVGVGVTKAGEALLSLGTSGVMFVANADYAPNPADAVHAFCHCIPNTWHQMSVILSAATCLDWLAELTHADSVAQLVAELDDNAEVVAQVDHPHVPQFLPYLSGERTPHNNPHAKGVFFGMTSSTQRVHLTKAVLEGVAFAFADGQQALLNSGSPIDQVSVIGGGSRSQTWGQILCNVLGRPLLFRDGGDVGPALGAARLAKLAILSQQSLLTDEQIQQVCPAPAVSAELVVDTAANTAYQHKLKVYQQLYRATVALL